MPDPRLGERACAFVVLAKGDSLTLEEVQRWMAEAGVAKPKWPERVETLDALPMTASERFRSSGSGRGSQRVGTGTAGAMIAFTAPDIPST